jgi:hypothetical protein
MGFWSVLGEVALEVGKAAVGATKEVNDRMENHKSDVKDLSDSQLKKILESELGSSFLKASAARKELLERGCPEDEVKECLRKYAEKQKS